MPTSDAAPSDLVRRWYQHVADDDVEQLASMYREDAQVIRFDGTSTGQAEIIDFLSSARRRHDPYVLRSVDQFTQSGDIVMWDASVETNAGVMQTTEILVLDGDGKIERHIPGIRGYWGASH